MSFDWKAEVRNRLLRRAGAIAPRARAVALLEGEVCDGQAEVVAAVRGADETPLAGYRLVAARDFRRPEPLYEVLGRVSSGLGRSFSPEGIFRHVGGRLAFRRVAGLREECWVRGGADVEMDAAPASRLALACVTVCGLGFLPVVGATLASLATALGGAAVWVFCGAGVAAACAAAAAVLATIASLLVERASERHFLSDDAREFVLDEVAGMALALAFVPAHAGPWGVVAAFVAFRFFDVLKPGIKWVERRKWRGKVVWDDLLAGLYAGLCVAAVFSLARWAGGGG